MMGSDSARAFYGPAHVLAAHELGAIQTLLLTDTVLRMNNVALRRQYAKLVDEVGAGGGQTVIFSGAQLLQRVHVACHQFARTDGMVEFLSVAYRYACLRRAAATAYRDCGHSPVPTARSRGRRVGKRRASRPVDTAHDTMHDSNKRALSTLVTTIPIRVVYKRTRQELF